MADVNTPAPQGLLVNAAKLVGDYLLPGVSLTVDGDVKRGAAHAAVALGAAALLGGVVVPAIWAAAGLNSFATSTTGKNLVEHIGMGRSSGKKA